MNGRNILWVWLLAIFVFATAGTVARQMGIVFLNLPRELLYFTYVFLGGAVAGYLATH